MLSNLITKLSAVAILFTGPVLLAAGPPDVVNSGHNPIETFYQNDQWSFFIDGAESGQGRLDPQSTVYHVPDNLQLTIPSNPNFSFLGNPGEAVWITPEQSADPNVLLLGVSGERISSGVFEGDQLNLKLEEVSGPGDFSMYQISGPGQVELFQNSADGIDASDVTPFGIGGHDHQNWAFNAPGYYRIKFSVFGTLNGGGTVSSPSVTYTLAVGVPPIPVDEGDADVAVILNGGNLALEVFWGLVDEAYAPDEAFYRVKANSQITVPNDPAYSFLGSPGSTAWVAPQAEQPGKLFLALAADNLPSGVFVDDTVEVFLKSVDGPGEFSLYGTDTFGTPLLYYNTVDGITASDVRQIIAGEHYHLNWGFTAAGTYTIGFEVRGVRVSDGQESVSAVTTFQFEVVEPVQERLSFHLKDASTITLSWETVEGAEYQLQSRDSVATGGWLNVGSPVTGDGNVQPVDVNIDPEAATKFYLLMKTGGE